MGKVKLYYSELSGVLSYIDDMINSLESAKAKLNMYSIPWDFKYPTKYANAKTSISNSITKLQNIKTYITNCNSAFNTCIKDAYDSMKRIQSNYVKKI